MDIWAILDVITFFYPKRNLRVETGDPVGLWHSKLLGSEEAAGPLLKAPASWSGSTCNDSVVWCRPWGRVGRVLASDH